MLLVFARIVQHLLSDEKSPHERRFGMPFNGPVIPFGAMVEYHHLSAKDSRDCISSAQKSCQVYSVDMRQMRGESGKETL